jgi:hypothetical protein
MEIATVKFTVRIISVRYRFFNEDLFRLEPCAVKVASTVLRGG